MALLLCQCQVLIVEVTSCNSSRLHQHCILGLVVVTLALYPHCCQGQGRGGESCCGHGCILQVTNVASASQPHHQSRELAQGEDKGEGEGMSLLS